MKKSIKYFRNKLIGLITIIGYKIFSKIPLSINVKIGEFLGKVFFYFDKKNKYVAYRNIKKVFPQKDFEYTRCLVKKMFCEFGKNIFEFFCFERMKYILPKVVRFEGESLELLKKLHFQGKGVLIFSGHFGNWELLGASLGLSGLPLAVIFRDSYIEEVNYLIKKLRTSVGEIVISRGGSESLKNLLFSLRKGYLIGVLIDQNISSVKNVNVPFLRLDAPTPISAVELAIKYKVPSVVGVIYRKDGIHNVKIVPIDEVFYTDKVKFVKKVNDILSEYIMKYPEQWVWIHNRWN